MFAVFMSVLLCVCKYFAVLVRLVCIQVFIVRHKQTNMQGLCMYVCIIVFEQLLSFIHICEVCIESLHTSRILIKLNKLLHFVTKATPTSLSLLKIVLWVWPFLTKCIVNNAQDNYKCMSISFGIVTLGLQL